MYRSLNPEKIVHTADTLRNRIRERFPESGLGKLAAELHQVAKEGMNRTSWIAKPHLPLRGLMCFLVAGIVVILALLVVNLRLPNLDDWLNFIQFFEASLSAMFFIGATVVFLVSCETRIKRQRALKALYELRAMAHIVDMHQLTKDVDRFVFAGPKTASSPRRDLTPFELSRYLDYCSELLSIISKIAALYIQGLEDQVVLSAVEDVENLTLELSQKVWQKITILEQAQELMKNSQDMGKEIARAGRAFRDLEK